MDKSIKVKQTTIDSMRQMGMSKALEKANSGTADAEFTEAAKRFYGNRVKKKLMGGPRMQPAGPTGHITEEVATTTTVSKNGPHDRKMA